MVSGCSYSCDQILVSQPPAGCAIDEAIKPQQCVACDVSIIEPEGEFVNIPMQMFRRDMVEGSINATLQDGPHAFNAVSPDNSSICVKRAAGATQAVGFVYDLVAEAGSTGSNGVRARHG